MLIWFAVNLLFRITLLFTVCWFFVNLLFSNNYIIGYQITINLLAMLDVDLLLICCWFASGDCFMQRLGEFIHPRSQFCKALPSIARASHVISTVRNRHLATGYLRVAWPSPFNTVLFLLLKFGHIAAFTSTFFIAVFHSIFMCSLAQYKFWKMQSSFASEIRSSFMWMCRYVSRGIYWLHKKGFVLVFV